MARVNNRFENYIKKKLDNKKSRSKKYSDLSSYLLSVSNNPTGTLPSDLLSKHETGILSEFIETMRKRHMPNSINLKLQIPTSHRELSQDEISYGPNSRKFIQKITQKVAWKTVWNGRGYLIGIITSKISVVGQHNLVYVCEDGKLRCTRGLPIFGLGRTKAHGSGAIPDLNRLDGFGFIVGKFEKQTGIDGHEELLFAQSHLESLLHYYVDEYVLKTQA